MTSQDIKKQLKEPHFWNIVLTGQHAEPRTKAMLEAKGIITWLPLAPVRRQWGRILKEIHTPVIPRCVFVYISNEERNTLQKSYRLLQPEVILLWGIERSGFFNGREKWAKGFENQRV